MCHLKLSKKCDFIDIFELSTTFWSVIQIRPRQIFTKLQKIVYFINIYILACKIGPMCYVKLSKKCDFADLFELSTTFWSVIQFRPCLIFTKPKQIVYFIDIYIFPYKLDLCATWNRTKSVILCRSFRIFHHFLERNSISAMPNFN